MSTTYYWAAYSGDTRIPGEDGPQHATLHAAIKAGREETNTAYYWHLRAMRDGNDEPLADEEIYDAPGHTSRGPFTPEVAQ